jgi:hypothetical protein
VLFPTCWSPENKRLEEKKNGKKKEKLKLHLCGITRAAYME